MLLGGGELVFFHPGEICIDQYQRRVRHCQEGGVIQYFFSEINAGTAPVAAGKIEQDMAVLMMGYLFGFLDIIKPDREWEDGCPQRKNSDFDHNFLTILL